MTGAWHAPVGGRQGKMASSQIGDLATTPSLASPVPAENPQIGSGQSERNCCSFSRTMGGECFEEQAVPMPCFAEPV